MKERKRRGVILISERHFSESVCRGSSELAVTVIVQHFLKSCESARRMIDISRAFAQREIGVGPARTSRVIVQILLIFWGRKIVKLASEQRVGVIELTLIRSLRVDWRPLRRFLLRGPKVRSIESSAGTARWTAGSSAGRARRTSGCH